MNNLNVKKALVVMNDSDINVVKSAANVQGIKTTLAATLNTYDVMKYDTVVATKAAIESIEEVYA